MISFQLNIGGEKVANLNSAVLKETKINYLEKGLTLLDAGLSYDFSNTTIYENGPLSFKISNGNITFKPNFIFNVDIKSAIIQRIVFLADNADLNFNCDFNFIATQKVQLIGYEKKLADVVKYFVVLADLVPIVVVVNTKVIAKFSADVNADFNLNSVLLRHPSIGTRCSKLALILPWVQILRYLEKCCQIIPKTMISKKNYGAPLIPS